jgi:hypothetical protein
MDPELREWLRASGKQFTALLALLKLRHQQRLLQLQSSEARARGSLWWPFTQHANLEDGAVTVVDSRWGAWSSGPGQGAGQPAPGSGPTSSCAVTAAPGGSCVQGGLCQGSCAHSGVVQLLSRKGAGRAWLLVHGTGLSRQGAGCSQLSARLRCLQVWGGLAGLQRPHHPRHQQQRPWRRRQQRRRQRQRCAHAAAAVRRPVQLVDPDGGQPAAAGGGGPVRGVRSRALHARHVPGERARAGAAGRRAGRAWQGLRAWRGSRPSRAQPLPCCSAGLPEPADFAWMPGCTPRHRLGAQLCPLQHPAACCLPVVPAASSWPAAALRQHGCCLAELGRRPLPGVQVAATLLGTVGKGWAARVFFSDDGSTAIEVALKMAFRSFLLQQGLAAQEEVQLKVRGLLCGVGMGVGLPGDALV